MMDRKHTSVVSGEPAPLERSRRFWQRFLTGLMLGVIVALTLGALTPVFAVSTSRSTSSWVRHNLNAQILVNEEEETAPAAPTVPNSPEPTVPDAPAVAPGGRDAIPFLEGENRVPAFEEPLPPLGPTDIRGHWAESCLTELSRREVLPLNDLYEGASEEFSPTNLALFYPDEAATWSVAISMLNRAFPTGSAYGGATLLETALQLPSPINVVYNYPQDSYDPNRVIARAEAIAALSAKAEFPFVSRATALLSASLEDGNSVPLYAREGIANALAANALVNHRNARRADSFSPVSRAEVAAMICQSSRDIALRRTISPEWVSTPATLPVKALPDRELRGVWITNLDSEVLFSKENLVEGIQRLKAMNINTLYPVVWHMGYTPYPSDVAERQLGKRRQLWSGENPSFEAAQGDRDMLQELIDLAHAEGMTVIPWFEFGFMAPAVYPIRNQHPEWFTRRKDGTQEIVMGEEVFTWMNPFHPQTRRLLLLLMNEVLTKYDVEGIQVDDHLGLPVDMGYDPFTAELYQQEHNGELPPDDENDPEWMRWRADKISDFMREVRLLVDRRKPGSLLSVSPNPYPFSYAKYLQDWPTWEAEGILDEVVVQVYREDLDRFVWELNKPAIIESSKQTPTSVGLLSGLRGRPTDVALLTEQLEAARDRGYAGISYFFYESLWAPGRETAEERVRQFQTSFSQPAVRP